MLRALVRVAHACAALSKPGNARPNHRHRPARPRAARSSCPRSRSRPSGRTSSACGATAFHPMCSYLASFPAALTHAFIARYSRPGDVVLDPFSRPRHDAAPGLRRGPDRRRQRPQPVRPPADRGQGRARRTRAEATHPPRGPPTRLERGRRRLARPRRARRSRGPAHPSALVPAAGLAATARTRRPSPSRPRSRSRSTRGRSASCCSSARTLRLDDRTDRFLAARAHGDPPRQERELPVRAHAQHVQHGAALRPRLRGDGPGSRSPERDVFDGLSAKLDRLYRQPLPAIDGDRARSATRATSPAARPGRAPGARPAGPGPPRRDLAAVPARRQVRLLQLAADVAARASTPARSTRRSTTPTTASRTSRSCATSSPTCGRSSPTTAIVVLVIGDVETDRGKPSSGGIGLAERVWEAAAEPEGYRLAGRRRSTTSRPTAR